MKRRFLSLTLVLAMVLSLVAGLTFPSFADSNTIVFGDLNLENGVQYSSPFDGGDFSVTFAGGSNDGKYYNTGTAIRVYGGGTMTVAADEGKVITAITVVFDGENKPTTADVVNDGTYTPADGTWSGKAASVVFTRPSGSGHWRVKSVSATVGSASAGEHTHVWGAWTHNEGSNPDTHTRTCTGTGTCTEGGSQTEPCSFTEKVVDPTYDAAGYTEHTCSKCGYSYNDTEVPALESVTFYKVTDSIPAEATKVVFYYAAQGKAVGTAHDSRYVYEIKPFDATVEDGQMVNPNPGAIWNIVPDSAYAFKNDAGDYLTSYVSGDHYNVTVGESGEYEYDHTWTISLENGSLKSGNDVYMGWLDNYGGWFYGYSEEQTGFEIYTDVNPNPTATSLFAGEDWTDGWTAAVPGENAEYQNNNSKPATDAADKDKLLFDYKYFIKEGKLYVGAKFNQPLTKGTGNGNSSFFRIWLKSNPDASAYTHFFDCYVKEDGTIGTRAAVNSVLNDNKPNNNDATQYTCNMQEFEGHVEAVMCIPLDEVGATDYLRMFINCAIEKSTGGATGNQCLLVPGLADAPEAPIHVTNGWTDDNGNIGIKLMDSILYTDAFEGAEPISVTAENGRWQNPKEQELLTYTLELADDGTNLYVRVIGDAKFAEEISTFRFWIRSNDAATVYTHFYDVDIAADGTVTNKAKYNKSTTENSGDNIADSAIEFAAKGTSDDKTVIVFKVPLAEFGGEHGFAYYAALMLKGVDYSYYPAPAGTDIANMPYKVWDAENEGLYNKLHPLTENVFDLDELKPIKKVTFTPDDSSLTSVNIYGSVDGKSYYQLNAGAASAVKDGVAVADFSTRGDLNIRYIKVTGDNVLGSVVVEEGDAENAKNPEGPYTMTGLNSDGYGIMMFTAEDAPEGFGVNDKTVFTNNGKNVNLPGSQMTIAQKVANGVYKILWNDCNGWVSGVGASHTNTPAGIEGIRFEDEKVYLAEDQVVLIIMSAGAYTTKGDGENSTAKWVIRGLTAGNFFKVDGEELTLHIEQPEAVVEVAAPEIDGVLEDDIWKNAEFKKIDGQNAGTWQNKPSDYTFEYAIAEKDGYAYFAVKSDKADMTQLRVWFHTNPEAKLYTHFFDVYTNGNPGGLKTNQSLTTNSGSAYDASKLEAAFDADKKVFEAKVKLEDVGATTLGPDDVNVQISDGNALHSMDLLPGNFTIDGALVSSAYMPWIGWFDGEIPTYAGLIPKTNHWTLTPVNGEYVKYYYVDDALYVVDEAQWPFMTCVYPEGDEQAYDIEGNSLRYNFSITNGTASIRLIFKTADGTVQYMMTNTALGLNEDQYIPGNGDFKATSCSGVITLQELVESKQLYQNSDFPAAAIQDGKITFAGIEIFAIGGATVVINELAVEPTPNLEPDNYLWMTATSEVTPGITITVPADQFDADKPLTIKALVYFGEDKAGDGSIYLNCYPYQGESLLTWVDYASTNIHALGEWHEIVLENYNPAKGEEKPDKLLFGAGFYLATGTVKIAYIKAYQDENEILSLTFENGYDLTGASGMTLENEETVWGVVGAEKPQPTEIELLVSHLNLYNWNTFDIMLTTKNVKEVPNVSAGLDASNYVMYKVEAINGQYVVKEFVNDSTMNDAVPAEGGFLLFACKSNRSYEAIANGELVGKELVLVDFDLKSNFAIDTAKDPNAAHTIVAKDYAPMEEGIPVSRDKSYTYPVNTRTDKWAENGTKLTDGKMVSDGGDDGYSGWGSEVEIVVDLEHNYDVDLFDVEAAANSGWGIQMPSGFKVSYSLDGETFTDIETASVKGEEIQTGGWVSALYTIELDTPVKARYVKISIIRVASFVWIDEVEVWAAGNHAIEEQSSLVQPAELVDLPDGAIVIDYAGYKHAGVVSIVAGDNQTVAELTARGNNGAAKDMNYAYNILVDKDNKVIDVDFTLAKACEFVCPEGGYIISYNGNKSGYEVMKEIEVGATITLYNILVDPIRELEGNLELTKAGFTYENPSSLFEKTVVVKDNEILTDGQSGFAGGWSDVGTSKVLLVANERCTEVPMAVTILHELDEVKKLEGYKLDLYHCANVMIGYPEGKAIVSVSTDGENWTDVGEFDLAEATLARESAGTVQTVFEFTAIEAKFVKIILNVGSNAAVLGDSPAGGKIYWEFISIAEVEVVEAEDIGPNYNQGDLNGDGEVDAIDYILLKKAILGSYTLTPEEESRADVNGDGEIDARDYIYLKKLVLAK